MRVAAIDCGTNSLRLLVADVTSDGRLVELDRRTKIVRLGEGVDATRAFSDDALRRTFAVVEEYADEIAAQGVDRLRFVATSASRDVSNRAAFEAGIQQRLDVLPDVISGDEEAALSFAGATGDLPAAAAGPFLVIDIGGGSTEFVFGDQHPLAARSVDMGCVRMSERHLRTDPPTAAEIAAATHDIDALVELAATTVPFAQAKTVIGLAGSVTTMAAMALDLPKYDRAIIHGTVLTKAKVAEVAERFLAMSRAERAALPYLHTGRVDVIGAGALVLHRIMQHLPQSEVLVSEHDILDGIALALAG